MACFTCGYGETCSVSGIKKFFGKDTKITPDIIPCLEKQPEVIQKARTLGKTFGRKIKKIKWTTM